MVLCQSYANCPMHHTEKRREGVINHRCWPSAWVTVVHQDGTDLPRKSPPPSPSSKMRWWRHKLPLWQTRSSGLANRRSLLVSKSIISHPQALPACLRWRFESALFFSFFEQIIPRWQTKQKNWIQTKKLYKIQNCRLRQKGRVFVLQIWCVTPKKYLRTSQNVFVLVKHVQYSLCNRCMNYKLYRTMTLACSVKYRHDNIQLQVNFGTRSGVIKSIIEIFSQACQPPTYITRCLGGNNILWCSCVSRTCMVGRWDTD